MKKNLNEVVQLNIKDMVGLLRFNQNKENKIKINVEK